MKRILVPVDFSEQAEHAIKTASQIARLSYGKIYLLHMISLPSNQTDIEFSSKANNPAKILYLKKIHERFDEIMKADYLKGIEVQEEVRFHKTFAGIISYSRELNADLIIMGSHGATGLKEMFIGSNTEKVVRNSDVPVLVVKKGIDIKNINKFVFASDFSDNIKPSFGRFLKFASKFNAEVDLLFVNTVHNFETTQDTAKRLREFILEFDMPKHSLNIYNDSSIERGILNFAKEANADVIALNTHQRSGLSSMFNDSISEDLVNHAIKPVVTFKL
ncbi:MAG: universal stress protein UspA [Flavobacteriales bacterium]|nr:MAG: universal stress protein UspA [Flavobacteriales bacterium]